MTYFLGASSKLLTTHNDTTVKACILLCIDNYETIIMVRCLTITIIIITIIIHQANLVEIKDTTIKYRKFIRGFDNNLSARGFWAS